MRNALTTKPLVATLGYTFAACLMLIQAGCQTSARRFAAAVENKPAPDFSLEDLDGKTVRLSELRGTPVVLAFFAHGCGPCRAEAPYLSDLAREHASDGVVVLAVNSWDEDDRMLQKWAADEQLKQRILTYGREVNELYGLSGSVPAVVWIDAGGLVVETAWGKLGPARLERSTKRVLARS